jgi:hypothetical protein
VTVLTKEQLRVIEVLSCPHGEETLTIDLEVAGSPRVFKRCALCGQSLGSFNVYDDVVWK